MPYTFEATITEGFASDFLREVADAMEAGETFGSNWRLDYVPDDDDEAQGE